MRNSLALLFLSFHFVLLTACSPLRMQDVVPESVFPVRISDPNNWMVIVGDSGATGAVASPKISPNIENLAGMALEFSLVGLEMEPQIHEIPHPEKFNVGSPIGRATRISYSSRELAAASRVQQVPALIRQGRGSRIVDMPEYSWGYFVGRSRRVVPGDIVFVAQDGQRVDSIEKQFRRILETQQSTLPPLILMSFNANDLCDEQVFTETIETRAQRFEKEIVKQFERVFANYKPHGHRTHIVILAPLDVVNVLTNPKLLEQTTIYQGYGEIQCRHLRGPMRGGIFSEEFRSTLVGMCGAVLGTSTNQPERIQRLIDVQRAFVEVWKKKVQDWHTQAPSGFKFSLISDTRSIDFQAGDLANDCFHPGVRAHQKIASQVLQFLAAQHP